MEYELTIKGDNYLALKNEKGLGELLKPLTREIALFDTYIAGTMYIKDTSVLGSLKVGEKLLLRREDNKFDEKAILVLNAEGAKLGYVPERDNVIFSRLMDAGKMLGAEVKKIDLRGDLYQIGIGIFLVDF